MCRRWTAGGDRGDGCDGSVEGADKCVGGGLPEVIALTDVTELTEATKVDALTFIFIVAFPSRCIDYSARRFQFDQLV